MTQGKKFKRIVRERMARTGESYTTARMRVTCKHDFVPQGANDEDEVCRKCGESRENDRR